jgi:hypothetical protein
MEAHVRNDVKPSVGRVVTSHWFESVDVSLISVEVVPCDKLGSYKPTFIDLDNSILFSLFIACILLVKKAVMSTSRTLIA